MIRLVRRGAAPDIAATKRVRRAGPQDRSWNPATSERRVHDFALSAPAHLSMLR